VSFLQVGRKEGRRQMAEWVVCPSCLLKHSRRPDGKCPKCRTSLDAMTAPAEATPPPAAPAAPPEGALPPPPVFKLTSGVMEDDDVPLGARIGAVLMIVNALLFVAERVLVGQSRHPSSVVSTIIDLWIGISLLRGNEGYLTWARLRIVI